MLRPIVAGLVLVGCGRHRPPPDARPAPIVPVASVSAAPVVVVEEPPAPPAEETRTLAVPGAGVVELHAIGQAIEVNVPATGSWKKLEIARRSGDETQHETLSRSTRRSLHFASPGTSYVYRARTTGAWSSEVTIHVGVPIAAPPAPTEVTLRAETAFAVRIGWTARPGAAGFEIQRNTNGDFVRVALVNPNEREFVHHLRLPGESLVYRVRAFGAKGASTWATATTTMPTATDPKAPPMGPCIPAIVKAPKTSSCNPEISLLESPGGETVSNVPGAGNGCRRHLVGRYAGCPRELGVFDIQADVLAVAGHSDEGFPLLHAVMGAGQYVGAQLATLQFRHGRYVVADEAFFCGDDPSDAENPALGTVSEDVTSCAPPFPTCQRDVPF